MLNKSELLNFNSKKSTITKNIHAKKHPQNRVTIVVLFLFCTLYQLVRHITFMKLNQKKNEKITDATIFLSKKKKNMKRNVLCGSSF